MRIGIDMGGTKIEAIALAEDGAELVRRRRPTPCDDYPGTLAAIAGLVDEVETAIGARATVGVGLPGALSPATGLVKNANAVWVNGRPFGRDLEQALGRPVRVANDANCFTVSEATDGAAAGARLVFGVILGTGVGGGIAVDGRCHDGPNAVGGEWGHTPLPWPSSAELPGPACFCGRTGCLEQWLAGRGLVRAHREAGGEPAGAAEIAARAAAAEPAALQAFERYRDRLARALAVLIDVVDPDVIVLGGGLSNVEPLFEGLERRLGELVFGGECQTPIRRARHGDSSGVRGAAWLWPEGVAVASERGEHG